MRSQNNWKELTRDWFRLHFEHKGFLNCLKHNKVDVIWTGYGTSQGGTTMNGRYPLQRRAMIEEFDAYSKAYLDSLPFPVTTIEWVNMTYGSQSSDGLHGLAEVNLVKAYHILNVAKYLHLR